MKAGHNDLSSDGTRITKMDDDDDDMTLHSLNSRRFQKADNCDVRNFVST